MAKHHHGGHIERGGHHEAVEGHVGNIERGGHHEGVEGHGRHGGHTDHHLHEKFGKDHPSITEEGFIDHALRGGSGPSEGLHKYPVDRRNQHILTPIPMDNVRLAMHEPSSILDTDFHGGIENLEHSLKGTHAVNEEIGAAGPVHHIIIPDH
jgi:hypothetical protein